MPPYICYQPENRILLVDNKNLKSKLVDETGKVVISKRSTVRRYYGDIIRLARTVGGIEFGENDFINNLQHLLDYLNADGYLKKVYGKTFLNL